MDEIERRQGREKARRDAEDGRRKNEEWYEKRGRGGKGKGGGDGSRRAHNPEGAAPHIFGINVNWMQSQWWLVLFFGVLLAVFWKGKAFLGN